MKILVACEESQAVTKAFRALGHEAYSCDILPASGGHPEWHIQGDVLPLLKEKWDMIIAFPPCTYLTITGNRWFKPEYRERYPTREQDRKDAMKFFMMFANADCEKIAIENPVGVMSTAYRKADQIIQPWQFGDKAVKKTCLWLKGLPFLEHTKIVEPEYKTYNSSTKKSGKSRYPMAWTKKATSVERPKTFPGIADAMAYQWSNPPHPQGG